ncbi:uridine kinase family protein [Paenibacillus sp. 1001270B_150601_E10]|uniref:uridine kinase family protein n=1 Tax=Paenibacillus sp. 1001270B_150601_E10 TaxID=2787079 RepID=UPI00189D7E4E|nr:AAA family ATPase [Paenibacillus sp. 1001270B_150601_E10]
MQPILIGITGGSGSGKSTYCDQLAKALQDLKIAVVRTDQFFKWPLPKMISPITGEEMDDFNHPDCLNQASILSHLDGLLKREEPLDVILVEGIFTLQVEAIRDLLHLSVFIDLDSDERMYRRIKRNMKERGLTIEEIADYYVNAAKHREQAHVLLSKKYADLILNGNRLEEKQVALVEGWLRAQLK